jgi:putative acetyltransferase
MATTAPPDVRPFMPADYEAACALWQATPGLGRSDADEREPLLRFLARNPGCSFIAMHDAELVGTVLCGHDGRRGLVHHLVTAASMRRRGVGRRLLQAGLDALAAAGIRKCHLLVFRDNPDGLAFWRAVRATERTEMALLSMPTDGHAVHVETRED